MKRTENSKIKQYIKQEEPFQLMIKRARKKRQKRLIGLQNGNVINNFGQHQASAPSNI